MRLVATRGNRNFEEQMASKIRQVTIDRKDINSMEVALEKEHFDIIYDQICFNPVEAKLANDLFTGRVKRYVFTSSMAVYDSTQDIIKESNFDPHSYPIDLKLPTYDYKEGKRQAEAFLYQNASFPVVSVRPPMVISSEDARFSFHVNKIINKEPISVLDSSAMSFVSAEEIARFLAYIGTNSEFAGPINANNTGFFTTEELIEEIGILLNISPLTDFNEERSPYCIGQTLMLSNELAHTIGYQFRPTKYVIHELVKSR